MKNNRLFTTYEIFVFDHLIISYQWNDQWNDQWKVLLWSFDHFVLNSSHCSTTILSKHITCALTAVKDHVIKYSETAFSNSNVNYFWSIKISSEVIEKLRLRNFQGSQVSSFDFSTLYISLPHDLIKAKVLSLVNLCFNRESMTYFCTSDKAGFLATRSMTSINVGLALSYVKLLLSSWKTYMCNLKAWFINK